MIVNWIMYEIKYAYLNYFKCIKKLKNLSIIYFTLLLSSSDNRFYELLAVKTVLFL
jgi:hypothetical protein